MEESPMKFFPLSACIVAATLMLLIIGSQLAAGEGDGVTMRNGLMMMMKHGKAAMPMDEPVTMTNGTVVAADGTITLKGGREFRMRNGETMTMDGHLMKGGAPTEMEPVASPLGTPIRNR
jgi:uncharacterized protein DUF6799